MTFKSQDLRPAQIKKETLKTSVQQPLALYPAIVSLLGGVGILLFGASSLTLSALVGGSVLASSGWLFEYFYRGLHHSNNYISVYREKLNKQRIEAIRQLNKDLDGVKAEQAKFQLDLFQKKFNNFKNVLDRKLDESELTYNRYLAMAEQVYLNGLDNLDSAALALQSVSAIRIDVIDTQLNNLKDSLSKSDSEKREQLTQRKTLQNSQLERVDYLYLTNEKALTQLDEVSTTLANAEFSNGRASMDMELAMKELTHLIDRNNQLEASS